MLCNKCVQNYKNKNDVRNISRTNGSECVKVYIFVRENNSGKSKCLCFENKGCNQVCRYIIIIKKLKIM